jgi:hypothetical protein
MAQAPFDAQKPQFTFISTHCADDCGPTESVTVRTISWTLFGAEMIKVFMQMNKGLKVLV